MNWFDDPRYEDLLSSIEHYDSYDVLVHAGWLDACDKLRRGELNALDAYLAKLDTAAMISGTAKALAFTRLVGLQRLVMAHAMLKEAQDLRALAETYLDNSRETRRS